MFQIVIALIIQIPLALHAQTLQHIDLNNLSDPYKIDYATNLRNIKGPIDTKIVNGMLASQNQFPYQAAMILDFPENKRRFCGGSLISKDFVLTAAHCLPETPDTILVILGNPFLDENNPAEIKVYASEIVIHHAFNSKSLKNDICIIRLSQSINFTEAVSPISLPNYNDVGRNFLFNDGVVSGYGQTTISSNQKYLMYVKLFIIDNRMCNKHFNDISITQICTSGLRGRGACFGDSGGPLNIDGKLIGIVSYGSHNCDLPTIYTRVPMYLDWISSHTNIQI